MRKIVYLERPNLSQPCLILGFEGWPNAADVSSSALQYLIENLKARKFASLPTEDFYQTSSLRPVGVIKGGRLMELKFPGNYFYYSRNSRAGDFILFHGIEPHLHWGAFADLFVGLAQTFNVSQIYTIGGTYDYIPHTHPPLVSALFNHEDLRAQVLQAGLGLTEYTGPTSIHTFLLETARRKGLKAISLWGHAPQYLQTKNVRVVVAVLKSLVDMTGMEVDLSELERASDYFDQQINHLIEQDPKLQEVIQKLEEIHKQSSSPSAFMKKDETKEDKVIYIQGFLKRQGDEEKKES